MSGRTGVGRYIDPRRALRGRTRREPNGCLIWTGATTGKNGYGQVRLRDRTIVAHRLAFEIAHGREVREGHQLHHICRTRLCVEPKHLTEILPRPHRQHHPLSEGARRSISEKKRGERHHRARLTADQVREVRSLRGKVYARVLGPRFGVTESTIYDIWTGRSWRHV